jgi:hypothetical protein
LNVSKQIAMKVFSFPFNTSTLTTEIVQIFPAGKTVYNRGWSSETRLCDQSGKSHAASVDTTTTCNSAVRIGVSNKDAGGERLIVEVTM